jgi:hypothetical protein
MYCSSCGVAIAQGLSYCNYCGAKVNGSEGESSSLVKPELVVSAMVGLFILGLVAIAVLVGVLKSVAGFDLPVLIAVTFFSFVVMLLLEGMLIGLLLKGRTRTKQTGAIDGLKQHTTRELADVKTRALAEPALSVTDHTTRTLEPAIARDRRERQSE